MPRFSEKIPLHIQLWDKAEGKYIKATVRKPDGSELSGSPVVLGHVVGGYYTDLSLPMPNSEFVTAFYEVFNDAEMADKSDDHGEAYDTFMLLHDGSVDAGFLTAFVDTVSPEITAVVERVEMLGG